MATSDSAQAKSRGWLLGLLGVLIFAMTLPMTRLAVGPVEAPQLPPLFVTAGRAALAGLLSVLYLAWTRAPKPSRALMPSVLLCAAGTVIGFPWCLALALRQVPSMHAAVITGILPLATAVAAALLAHQRASRGFWVCAVTGCLLVLGFAWIEGGGRWVWADLLLLMAIISAAVGYVAGARVSQVHSAEHTICWVLVLSLPLTVPLTVALWPAQLQSVRASAWLGFGYVSLFSMWLGFFAWYRGLALGGVMQVSQVQLIQPFLSLLMAVPILHEPLNATTLGFAIAVLVVVLIGKRMPTSMHKTTAPRSDAPA